MPPISELTDASKIQTKSPSELYSLSKMAICLHTVELSRRLKGSKETENIKVFAIRPGFIKGKRTYHLASHLIFVYAGTELGRHTNFLLRILAKPLISLIAKTMEEVITILSFS